MDISDLKNWAANHRYAILFFLGLLLAWESAAAFHWINIRLLPPPSAIFGAFLESWRNGELKRDFLVSIWRAGIGLGAGFLLGAVLGILTGRSPAWHRLISPLFNTLRAFPPVALLPVYITLLGIGNFSKIVSIACACIFPVWVNTHLGASRVPEEYLQSARLMTDSRTRIFFRVIMPSALPWILGGLRQALAMSFIMLYVSELAGASAGLGYQISSSHLAYRMDKMFAALFVLGALAAGSDTLISFLTKRLFPWLRFN